MASGPNAHPLATAGSYGKPVGGYSNQSAFNNFSYVAHPPHNLHAANGNVSNVNVNKVQPPLHYGAHPSLSPLPGGYPMPPASSLVNAPVFHPSATPSMPSFPSTAISTPSPHPSIPHSHPHAHPHPHPNSTAPVPYNYNPYARTSGLTIPELVKAKRIIPKKAIEVMRSTKGANPQHRPTAITTSSQLPPSLQHNRTFAEDLVIVDVWAKNLQEEIQKIMEIVDDYNYIAMDTEFPGVVARPIGSFKNSHDYHYQTLKCNVDLLKIIQLGLCFCDEDGNMIPGMCTWQFNFKFNLSEDMYAQDSIDLLAKSGIDFKEHDAKGIDVQEFGEILMTSGIVLNDHIKWISFHSGYDYGYLLKVLTCQPLPKDEADFFELLKTYFPCVYDIKYLMKSCEDLKGGLQKVAEKLEVERIGPQHQAGSDSLLTAAAFFKMRSLFFENNIDDDKYMGVLFGLGQNLQQRKKSL